MSDKTKNYRVLNYGAIGFIIAFFAIMGFLTPFFEDDYQRIADAGGFYKLYFHKSVFIHIYYTFFTWNARFGEALSHIYFYLDPMAKSYPILLPIVQLINILLLFTLFYARKFTVNRKDIFILFAIFGLYTLGVASPGTSLFWIAGMFNYSIQLLVFLLFLLPFRYRFENKLFIINKKWELIYLIFLGGIAGLGFENAAPFFAFVLLVILVLAYKGKINFLKSHFSNAVYGFGFYCFGFLLTLPASLIRKTHDTYKGSLTFLEGVGKFFHNALIFSYNFDILLLIILLFPFYKNKISVKTKKLLIMIIITSFLPFILILLFVRPEINNPRVYFISSVVIIMAILLICNRFYDFIIKSKLSFFIIGIFILYIGLIPFSYKNAYLFKKEMLNIAKTNNTLGIKENVIIPLYNLNKDKNISKLFKRFRLGGQIPSSWEIWISPFFEKIYNTKSIIFKKFPYKEEK